MDEVELECAVYGEGTVFPVKIARDAEVSALQEAIFYKKRYNHQYKFDASALTLYLARKKEGENDESKWLKDDESVEDFLSGKIDTAYKKMRPTWILGEDYLGANFQPGRKEIHILVERPEGAAGVATKQGEWSTKDLSTVDPDVQLNVWKSVVRTSSEDVFSGTALVIDRTATHLYLLTNLHLWIEKDEEGKTDNDKIFLSHLSADFKKEIKRYGRFGRKKNTKPNGQKRKPTDDSKGPPRKSSRTLKNNAPVASDATSCD